AGRSKSTSWRPTATGGARVDPGLQVSIVSFNSGTSFHAQKILNFSKAKTALRHFRRAVFEIVQLLEELSFARSVSWAGAPAASWAHPFPLGCLPLSPWPCPSAGKMQDPDHTQPKFR